MIGVYYYAYVDIDTGVCYEVLESEVIIDNVQYIQIDSLDKSLEIRKKYVNGEWVDTTAGEAANVIGEHVGIGGEWLDIVLNGKAPLEHTHAEYSPTNHTHAEYATTAALNDMSDVVSGKANVSHTHDNIYYTETEIDTKLATKADVNHTHGNNYSVVNIVRW